MKRRRPSHATVVAYLALALAMSGTAYAANGGAILLGKRNVETVATNVTNARGSALALVTPSTAAPFVVTSSKLVQKLNADLLDGFNATAFARTTGRTGAILGSGRLADDDGNGTPDYSVADAVCPPGTILTGGGGFAMGASDWLWFSGPSDARTWTVGADTLDPSKLEAYAVCYNPTGPVPGAVSPKELRAATASHRTAGKR